MTVPAPRWLRAFGRRRAAAVRVDGVVGDAGVCAVRRGGEARWTASVELSAWRVEAGPPQPGVLVVEADLDGAQLAALQRRLRPGVSCALRVSLPDTADARARLRGIEPG
ncbi:hypothetical protein ACFOED_12105 [Vulcaniibacterium thermophilum]|uniref:Uncharacterized protein n=1 Tax=Vulcaniibacterium thermophilum TaxID=1169913 RepID=A0A918Z881_9GAMM|nr:hypothetical protein [Vulcaniibacterium thermophilum]GHE39903.1 hypothetical protein GCM10007167_22470 [Vulcaniibacterium thermophilum]